MSTSRGSNAVLNGVGSGLASIGFYQLITSAVQAALQTECIKSNPPYLSLVINLAIFGLVGVGMGFSSYRSNKASFFASSTPTSQEDTPIQTNASDLRYAM